MRQNLKEQRHSNIHPERYPTPCLGIATTPPAFLKKIQKSPPPPLPPLIKKFWKFRHPVYSDPPSIYALKSNDLIFRNRRVLGPFYYYYNFI